MKATELRKTELRIGNLVTDKWSVGKYPFKIVSLGKTICHYFGHQKFSAKYEDLEPIPLNKEWLLKFGFEKDNELNFVKFSFKVHFWSNYNSYMYGWIGGNIEIKYVHQLQNLYFALTGEELTI